MADLSPADAIRLKEDLTIQQVILESLQSEDFDGVDQEREDAQDEIKRLTGLLKAAAAAAAAASGMCMLGLSDPALPDTLQCSFSLRFCFFRHFKQLRM